MNSREYLERIKQRDRRQDKEVVKMNNTVSKLYNLALRDIERDLIKILESYGVDQSLSYTDFIKTLPVGETKNLREKIREYTIFIQKKDGTNKHLIRDLTTLYNKGRLTRLDGLLFEINKNIDSLNLNIKTSLTNMLLHTAQTIYGEVLDDCKAFLQRTVPTGMLSNKRITSILNTKWVGKSNFINRINSNSKKLKESLRLYATNMLLGGKSLDTSVKNYIDDNPKLMKQFSKDVNTHRSRVKTAIRTEYNFVANQSTKLAYEEAEVEMYQVLAHIDSRTSKICSSLNGLKYNMKDIEVGVNYPPFHPNCRTTTIPVF